MSQQVNLRPLVFDDAEALFPAFSDEETMRYWSRGPIATVQELREYMKWNVEGKGVDCRAICTTDAPDEAMGWVVAIEERPRVYEVGFILRPDARGHGYGSAALDQMLVVLKREKRARRVCADVDPDNQPSIRLLESKGFVREGRLRATWETHIGVRDSLIYGLVF